MRYPTMTVDTERIDKLADIAICPAYPANLTIQLQPVKAVESSRCLHSSDTRQYVISRFEVRESEI
jgi:hypothetical protein